MPELASASLHVHIKSLHIIIIIIIIDTFDSVAELWLKVVQIGHPALKEHLFAHPTPTACHMFDASDMPTQQVAEQFNVSSATI